MPSRILVVEDESVCADLMKISLSRDFPKATITVVNTLEKTLEIIRSNEPPDIVMLDLTLADSDRDNTLRHLPEIHSRAQVVIATGEPVEAIPKDEEVSIIDKTELARPGIIAMAVKAAMQAWRSGPTRVDK